MQILHKAETSRERGYGDKTHKLIMEVPPAVTTTKAELRQTFIVVVKDCEPGVKEKTYKEKITGLLKANGIHESPLSISNNSCSFIINLLETEQARLSQSNSISSIDIDQNLSIPTIP